MQEIIFARLIKVFMSYVPLDLDIICKLVELVWQTTMSIFNESSGKLVYVTIMI